MENFVKLIGVLAWPAAVLTLAFAFRAELRKALNRISKLKYKELEATFDNELSQVENRTGLYLRAEESPLTETPAERCGYAQLLRIAEVSPRAAVTEAWRKLESTVDRLATNMGIDPKIPMSGVKAIRLLIRNQQVAPSLLDDYNRLRDLRNQAVHAEEFGISQTEAERYAALAIEIAEYLNRFIRKTATESPS
jgi:hypothetical protein